MSKSQSKGLILALIAAFISGISIFINKFAVGAIKQPLVFTTFKNTGVALFVLLFLTATGKLKNFKKLLKKDIRTLLLIGIIGGSLPFYLFFTGLSMIPAVNGAIIHKTLVLWVGLLASRYLKEKLSKLGWIAVITLLVSNILVGGFRGFELSMGEMYVLLATVFWAIETILVKKVLPSVDPEILLGARMGIGSIILLTMSAIIYPSELATVFDLSANKIFWILATMITFTLYFVYWYRGLKLISATSATAVLVFATLITNALSAVFVTHTLNSSLIAQSLLVALGVFVIYKVECGSKIRLSSINPSN